MRRSAELERDLASRGEMIVLRCFGHEERLNENCVGKRVLMEEVSRVRVGGRPRLDWMDSVKVALGSKGITIDGHCPTMSERQEGGERPGASEDD